MSANKTWIEEQKAQQSLFRGPGHYGDADKLLEKSPANRFITVTQGKLIITARVLGQNLGINCLGELADAVEYAQLCVDKDSRKDFMKVAIEQWQGKLANAKHKLNETVAALL